ncbi:MAG: AarF/ABC1/UbiB kinase family protein, partial [Actinobacteria bacterium]|nr:AarF/ABC1/UbiB kinase family protein [Actinomycetota bacterium]
MGRTGQIGTVLARRALIAVRRSRMGLATRSVRVQALAEQLRLACEEVGPTFVKIGQLMSVRPDIFSAELCFELAKLRDTVSPLPYEEVRRVIIEEFGREPEELFNSFDPNPEASASIAQVHRARLREPSRPVWGDVMPAGTPVAV